MFQLLGNHIKTFIIFIHEMVDCLRKLCIIFKITKTHHFRGADNSVLIDMLMKINQHFKMHVFQRNLIIQLLFKKNVSTSQKSHKNKLWNQMLVLSYYWRLNFSMFKISSDKTVASAVTKKKKSKLFQLKNGNKFSY